MPRKRKNLWTARVMPAGSLKTNEQHPYHAKPAKYRYERSVALMKEALATVFHELMEVQFGKVQAART